MAGGAFAAGAINKGPVAVVTTTGGPTVVTGATADPFSGGQDIPLASPTFTQKAGQVVLVAGELNVTAGTPQNEQNCDLEVTVDSTSSGDQTPSVGLTLVRLAQRGDPGDRLDSEAMPAPASDRVITLAA